MNQDQRWQEFLNHYQKIRAAQDIQALVGWDMETLMPPAGAAQRADYMQFLSGQVHQLQTGPTYIETLELLNANSKSLTPDQKQMVFLERRKSQRAKRVPQKLMEEMARLEVEGNQTWLKARKENQYPLFANVLEKILKLKKDYARCIQEGTTSLYETLMQDFEPDLPLQHVRKMFEDFKSAFLPLLSRVLDHHQGKGNSKPLPLTMDLKKQEELSEKLLRVIGFDFQRGRVDTSAHPFCSGSGSDVRITTRYREDDWTNSLYSILHECGHALFELGIGKSLERKSPLACAPGMGIHESQSRFLENIVGRSKPFCEFICPWMGREFGIKGMDPDSFYNFVNRPQQSLIRVEADEVTYNFHILIRFEIEDALFEEHVNVNDLPALWNQKYQHYLDIKVPSDTLGVLQDVHWAWGTFGYFPTYSLGNFASAQLMEAMKRDLDLDDCTRKGNFGPILQWNFEHVHQHGYRFTFPQLIEKATGQALSPQPFVNYITKKFLSGNER